MEKGSPPDRLHYLDAMRSIMMLLGILLHAATPYRPDSTWLVRDTATNGAMTVLVDVVHLFRMPTFFVVAGFFAMLSLSRRSTTAFLRERLTRVVVPLCTTLLILNIPQVLLLHEVDNAAGSRLTALRAAWWDGRLVGHLWFLVDLALFFLVVAALSRWIRTALLRHAGERMPAPWQIQAAVGLALTWAVGIAVMDYFGPPWLHQQVGGVLNPVEWLEYAPFFVGGALLYQDRRLLRLFGRVTWIDAVLAAIATIAWITTRDADGVTAVVAIAARTFLMWFLVRACFAIFHRFASDASALFRYLSEASYTIYLVHHILVIGFALALRPMNLPALAKFTLVVLGTTMISVTVYHLLVRRSRVLMFLLNGKNLLKPVAS